MLRHCLAGFIYVVSAAQGSDCMLQDIGTLGDTINLQTWVLHRTGAVHLNCKHLLAVANAGLINTFFHLANQRLCSGVVLHLGRFARVLTRFPTCWDMYTLMG